MPNYNSCNVWVLVALSASCIGKDDVFGQDTTGPTSGASTSVPVTTGTPSDTSGQTDTTTTDGVTSTTASAESTDSPMTTTTTSVCGNAAVEADEECDAASLPTAICDADCTSVQCGDGIINDLAGETCEDGKNAKGEGVECRDDCRYCGDGAQNSDTVEECDDGDDDNSDECLDTCKKASCGDGYVQSDVEECDGNPDPEANSLPCDKAKCVKEGFLVFVSSTLTSGAISADPNVTGIAAADALCAGLVSASTLSGIGFKDGVPWPFKAWLSAGTNDSAPLVRFASLKAPYEGFSYIGSDGTMIASTKKELLSGTLASSVALTENGDEVAADESVWTATAASGGKNGTNSHCEKWASSDPGKNGGFGNAGAIDPEWTVVDVTDCDNELRIYCFEQPPA